MTSWLWLARGAWPSCKVGDGWPGRLPWPPPLPLLQLIVHTLGGEVKTAEGGGEYGRMPMRVERQSMLFATETQDSQLVWMSHGDEAVKLPDGFSVVARSEQGAIVAVENPQRRIFGLQYHPEVVHR